MFQPRHAACRPRRPAARPRFHRLALEALEDRTVFAATLSIPTGITSPTGATVTVPVLINQLNDGAGATGLSRADIDVVYDPTLLTINPTQVTLGSLFSPDHWSLSASTQSDSSGPFAGKNELIIHLTAPDGVFVTGTGTGFGSLVNFKAQISGSAPPGTTTPLNLVNDATAVTDLFGANGQQYALNPPPTDGADPGVDGSITIGLANPQTTFVV